MGEGDTLLNAVVGAVAAVALSFLPFGIVLGGAVGGYLQGAAKDYREGATVGALAGLFALLPILASLFVAGAAIPFLPLELGALSLVVLPLVLFVSAGYLVGGGALGGALGAYLVDEF